MNKWNKWLSALFFSVAVYSCIRWVTDYTKEGQFWTQTFTKSVTEIVILVVTVFLLLLGWDTWLENSRKLKDVKGLRLIWRFYMMPYLSILIFLNGTMLITRLFTGDSLTMDGVVIANVVGGLFSFMYYNIHRSRIMDRENAEQRVQLEKIRNDQLQTELKFLKSQYHPHFLFNTLNTVYFQIDENNQLPRRTLEMLSDLLRYQLYGSNQKVTLRQEMDYMRIYIDLQKMRISERLQLRVEFPSGLEGLSIYPLLFLPLIENAFKYVGGDYQLDIRMTWEPDWISLSVRNSIPDIPIPMDSSKKGIGLENLGRRLALLYPAKHVLETRKLENEFVAILMIEINEP